MLTVEGSLIFALRLLRNYFSLWILLMVIPLRTLTNVMVYIKLIKKKHGKNINKINTTVGKLRMEAKHVKRALSS